MIGHTAIAKYVLENNITDETKVAQMIKDSILAHPGLTKAEVQEMINKVPAQILASQELKNLIEEIALEINHADSALTYTLAGHVAQHCDSIKANSDSITSLIKLTTDFNLALSFGFAIFLLIFIPVSFGIKTKKRPGKLIEVVKRGPLLLVGSLIT